MFVEQIPTVSKVNSVDSTMDAFTLRYQVEDIQKELDKLRTQLRVVESLISACESLVLQEEKTSDGNLQFPVRDLRA